MGVGHTAPIVGFDDGSASSLAAFCRTTTRHGFSRRPLLRLTQGGNSERFCEDIEVGAYAPGAEPFGSREVVPEAVVDLSYRCTLDRTDVVRVASVGEAARGELRYALARLDSLRAVQVGFKVENVIGRSIVNVEVPTRNPILLRFHLDDGTTVDLLQQPAEPGPGPARGAIPSPAT